MTDTDEKLFLDPVASPELSPCPSVEVLSGDDWEGVSRRGKMHRLFQTFADRVMLDMIFRQGDKVEESHLVLLQKDGLFGVLVGYEWQAHDVDTLLPCDDEDARETVSRVRRSLWRSTYWGTGGEVVRLLRWLADVGRNRPAPERLSHEALVATVYARIVRMVDPDLDFDREELLPLLNHPEPSVRELGLFVVPYADG